MHATAAVEHKLAGAEINDMPVDSAGEVTRLLLRAATCVERDEAIAIDLVKKASTLLGTTARAEGDERATGRPVSGGLAPWQVKRLKTFIAENISASICLDDLARQVNLSTSYFSAAFKVSFGVSPHSYVVSRRVEYAKHRMLHSDAPLCEIALDCGLADQAHLSRVFRRMTGTTPSAWRRYSTTRDAVLARSN